ncbi:MAG: phosphotransferase [Saprospiraceae bacterium]
MNPKEIKLTGGRSTESVVKIGNHVHRSMSSNAPFIHELLQHLEKHNFSFSPKFIGIDKKGREILSFINGEVLVGEKFNDQQIIGAVKILRQFHDIAAKSNLCKNQETICHHDFAPWNIIFENNFPVGIIDFDDSAPGARIDDLAYFIWTFLELGNDLVDEETQIQKLVLICKKYELKNPKNLVDAIIKQQNRILKFREERAENEIDLEKREFSKNKIQSIKADLEWIKTRKDKIEKFLNQNILF